MTWHTMPMSAGVCDTCGKNSKCRLGSTCPDCAEKAYIESYRERDEDEAARHRTATAQTTTSQSAPPDAAPTLPEASPTSPPTPLSLATQPPQSHATPLSTFMKQLTTPAAAPLHGTNGEPASPTPGFAAPLTPAISAEAPLTAEATESTSLSLPADRISGLPQRTGEADEAAPHLEAGNSRGETESLSTNNADEASAAGGESTLPKAAASQPNDALHHRPLPANKRGRKRPDGELSYRTVWELRKQIRTGESLRGRHLTPEKADELQQRLRFASAAEQIIVQPLVETIRTEATGVKQHVTDLAMGSVCLAPGTTPQDEYRANLLQIRQLQSRNSYLKEEAAPKTKRQRRCTAYEGAAAKTSTDETEENAAC